MLSQVFRVLVVEDEPIAGKVSTNLLQHFSFKVETARTSQQALRKAALEYYHLIFMDIGLKHMNGFELTKHIRATCPKNHSTPIIALTKHKGKRMIEKCKEYRMDGYLTKPFTFEKCRQVIDKFSAGELWLT
jgi:CheY-like chemotaxis protein